MAATVRVESKMFEDPRFDLLGRALGMHGDEARFRMCRVYRHCTETGDTTLAPELVDVVFGCDNASQAIAGADLGVVRGALLYVRGTKDRTGWLRERRAASKRGGLKTRERFRKQAPADRAKTIAKTTAKGQAKGEPRLGPPVPVPVPVLNTNKRCQAAPARDLLVRWLEYFNGRNGRAFKPRDPLIANVRTLMAKGYGYDDLWCVAEAKRIDWAGDAKMAKHLVPATILRPSNFESYVDDARERWHKQKESDARRALPPSPLEGVL